MILLRLQPLSISYVRTHATGFDEIEAKSEVYLALLVDCAKGALMMAMQKTFKLHADSFALLEFMHQPYSVKTKQAIVKGSLKIPCCSTASKIAFKDPMKVAKKTTNTVEAKVVSSGGTEMQFAVASHISPFWDSDGKKQDTVFICPFWFMKRDSNGDMELVYEEVKVDDFMCHIPVAVNKKRLNKEQLVTLAVPDEDTVAAPPTKKAKQ